jgi:RNA polymerase sigma-70 factor (ECF subfamily)
VFDTQHHEREILKRLIEGDEVAFEKIYRSYSPRLFAKLLRLVKTVSQSEEILQEVFIKIWEYRSSIDLEKSFNAFVFKVAENKVYDFYRKTTRDQRLKTQLMSIATEDDLALKDFINNEEKLALLQNAVAMLPITRQQVFRLVKLERRSYKEVSEMLGISLSTISDHIVKATKSIRAHLEGINSALLCPLLILWIILQ